MVSAIKSSSKKMQVVMDQIPVELIGNILAHLGEARDIVIASATCRKWHEAWRNHVHNLLFCNNHYNFFYRKFTTNLLQVLITRTIFQTSGLRSLSVLMDNVENDEFSAAAVIAWLRYAKETLRELHFSLPTTSSGSILEECGMLKLEVLSLKGYWFSNVDNNCLKFHCLKSLSLSCVSLSLLELTLVLSACPSIEVFELISAHVVMLDANAEMKLSSNSLKSFHVDSIYIDTGKFIIEADNLEKLHLEHCMLNLFVFVGKRSLKVVSMFAVKINLLDIGQDLVNLETVDMLQCYITWFTFYNSIKRSSKLRKLMLWKANFHNKDDILDMRIVPICFPRLSYLSLDYDFVKCDFLHIDSEENQIGFENLVVLELRGIVEGNLPGWLDKLLQKCPNLKKLVIRGIVPRTNNMATVAYIGRFTSSVTQPMRRHTQVQVSLEFETMHGDQISGFDPTKHS